VGLSLDFELLNLLGFAAYTAFASSFYGSARIQKAYEERHDGNESKVTVQDLVFAVSRWVWMVDRMLGKEGKVRPINQHTH